MIDLYVNKGYVIDSSGLWLIETDYFHYGETNIFIIWGFFTMIVILFHIILFFKYGKEMLEPIMHIQTIMLLVISSGSIDNYWIDYLFWIQMFKFDFRFVSVFDKHNIWTKSSGKLLISKLFWEETACNYLNLFAILAIIYATK